MDTHTSVVDLATLDSEDPQCPPSTRASRLTESYVKSEQSHHSRTHRVPGTLDPQVSPVPETAAPAMASSYDSKTEVESTGLSSGQMASLTSTASHQKRPTDLGPCAASYPSPT